MTTSRENKAETVQWRVDSVCEGNKVEEEDLDDLNVSRGEASGVRWSVLG